MRKNIPVAANPLGNEAQRRTDYQLNDQPGPIHIPRMWMPNIRGMLGNDANFTPSTGDTVTDNTLGPIGHTVIPKYIYRPPTQSHIPVADDTLQITSPAIGMPGI